MKKIKALYWYAFVITKQQNDQQSISSLYLSNAYVILIRAVSKVAKCITNW